MKGHKIPWTVAIIIAVALATSAGNKRPHFTLEPPSRVLWPATRGAHAACRATGHPPPDINWVTAEGQILTTIPGLRCGVGVHRGDRRMTCVRSPCAPPRPPSHLPLPPRPRLPPRPPPPTGHTSARCAHWSSHGETDSYYTFRCTYDDRADHAAARHAISKN